MKRNRRAAARRFLSVHSEWSGDWRSLAFKKILDTHIRLAAPHEKIQAPHFSPAAPHKNNPTAHEKKNSRLFEKSKFFVIFAVRITNY
jgi:hypothetical protein